VLPADVPLDVGADVHLGGAPRPRALVDDADMLSLKEEGTFPSAHAKVKALLKRADFPPPLFVRDSCRQRKNTNGPGEV
jgi:hypothetical protein